MRSNNISIDPEYRILVRDHSLSVIREINPWISISTKHPLNEIGSFALTVEPSVSGDDLRVVDNIIQVQRRIPAVTKEWSTEFAGFIRKFSTNSYDQFVTEGVGLLDLVARRLIGYLGGTIKSYKMAESETVIKQYVEENCGASALVTNGRQRDGALKFFFVEPEQGRGYIWSGDKAFEQLMDIVKSIGAATSVDFGVELIHDNSHDPVNYFLFKTYHPLGTNKGWVEDRSVDTLGFFHPRNNNVYGYEYILDRTTENNVCFVLGDGTQSLRTVVIVSSDPSVIEESPWNDREFSRPQSGFISQMQDAGTAAIVDGKFKETVQCSIVQSPNCLYPYDYSLGDYLAFVPTPGKTRNLRVTGIDLDVGSDGVEKIGHSISFFTPVDILEALVLTFTTTSTATLVLDEIDIYADHSITVDWGDGVIETWTGSSARSHIYASGVFVITINDQKYISVLHLNDARLSGQWYVGNKVNCILPIKLLSLSLSNMKDLIYDINSNPIPSTLKELTLINCPGITYVVNGDPLPANLTLLHLESMPGISFNANTSTLPSTLLSLILIDLEDFNLDISENPLPIGLTVLCVKKVDGFRSDDALCLIPVGLTSLYLWDLANIKLDFTAHRIPVSVTSVVLVKLSNLPSTSNFGALKVLTYLKYSNLLTAPQIDKVLKTFCDTGVMSMLSNPTIDLTGIEGAENSAPSSTGNGYANRLRAAGWTVSTN